MAQEPNIYDLYEKMGSTLNAVDKLNSELRRMESEQNKRHEENVKRNSEILEKLRDFKHEQSNNEHKILGQIFLVKQDVKNLKKPVDEIIAIRSRVGVILGFVLSIGGCVWFFLQPAWSFFSERWIGHMVGGQH